MALAAIVLVKYRPLRHFFQTQRKAAAASSDTEDTSEVMSLLAHSSASPSPRSESMDALEHGLLTDGLHNSDGDEDEGLKDHRRHSSLLEAIMQAKEQPSGVQQQLNGYREIL